MHKYSSSQINAVLHNPNEFPPQLIVEMLLDECFTVGELEKNGLSNDQKQRIKNIQLTFTEEADYKKCMQPDVSIDALRDFVNTYSGSSHLTEVRDKLNKMEIGEKEREEEEKKRKEEEEKKRKEEEEKARRHWEEEERKRQEEEERKRILAERADNDAWREVIMTINNPNYDVNVKYAVLDEYQNKFPFGRHSNEIENQRKIINMDAQAMPVINHVLDNPLSRVIDFIHLWEKYPMKRDYLRDFMMKDMRVNPSRYNRIEMNWLLKGKHDALDNIDALFTADELAHIVPRSVFEHILSHPTDESDRDPLEEDLVQETNFRSNSRNTDIYFFGVPGSGKTTVLAGLFNIDCCDDLRLRLPAHGDHIGYAYASILINYLRHNLFPQRTKTKFVLRQALTVSNPIEIEENPFSEKTETSGSVQGSEAGDKFIQIMDAELYEKNAKGVEEKHQLSIIEMPGERTLDFAAADIRDMNSLDKLLGEGTKELFLNNNRKVFFFVIDPRPELTYNVKLNGVSIPLTQAQALSALVEFLNQVPGLIQKIDAVQIILTKSDLLRNSGSIDCIMDDVIKKGYEGLLKDLQALCSPGKGNVNAQCGHRVHLFTFRLGRVYPGHMIKYDKEDSQKILKVIAANTLGINTVPSKWDSIVEWMNQ